MIRSYKLQVMQDTKYYETTLRIYQYDYLISSLSNLVFTKNVDTAAGLKLRHTWLYNLVHATLR